MSGIAVLEPSGGGRDGHIDAAVRGVGSLWKLAPLSAGSTVQVRTTSGHLASYTVQARRVYQKSSGLPAALFSRSGPAQLILISCGGPFDRTTKSYLDNVAVYAIPAS